MIPSVEIENTQDLFMRLGVNKNTLSSAQKKFLNEEGYLIIPPTDFLKKNIKTLNDVTNELIKKEGVDGGWEGKEKNNKYGKGLEFEVGSDRLGNLIEKDIIFRQLLLIPEVLASAFEVINSDIKVSGLNLRNPRRGYGKQSYHIDCAPKNNASDNFCGVVCIMNLDDTTLENGATRIIPKTQKIMGWPNDHINVDETHKCEIRTTLPSGSITVINMNTWHAGATNVSGEKRKTISLQILRRDEPQLLNYKKYLQKKTINSLSEALKYLLATRESDFTFEEMSASPGQEFKKKFGKERY